MSGPFFRRDVLANSAYPGSLIHCLSAGTEVPREKRGFMECGDSSPLSREGFSLRNAGV
ncbi:hypothetical protein THTE_3320 [Thermogutta terrifontis]|uniref:Uncharacterized protein n=1 Tax=Thermogutta terrifontis TaxID=1331910 RepID=A0A286RJ35_9BACT|nr:hypothetical protein THTE_3320 [Thermogutta terrifontis]